MSSHCSDTGCDVREVARKFQAYLRASGWHETTFGAVVWHKGEHHIPIDPDLDILATCAATEGLTSDELRAKIEAIT